MDRIGKGIIKDAKKGDGFETTIKEMEVTKARDIGVPLKLAPMSIGFRYNYIFSRVRPIRALVDNGHFCCVVPSIKRPCTIDLPFNLCTHFIWNFWFGACLYSERN